jgi:simple sugar transport system permease protein
MSAGGTTGAGARKGAVDAVVRYGLVAVTVGLVVVFAATEPAFRTQDTLFSVLKFASATTIVGLGVTLSLVVGGMDLSVGSTAGLGVSVAAWTMVVHNQVGGVAIAVVLLAGAAVGLVNAVLIVLARIPDLLATLTMMFVVVGLKLVLVNGQSISSGMTLEDGTTAPGRFTEGFLRIDRGYVGPVPVPVVLALVLAVVVGLLLTRTRWGRLLYAVGANAEAVRLAGIRVGLYRGGAYVASGVLAATGGLVLAARIGQGDVSAGNSLLLDSVAVALVGTAAFGANRPNAAGTVLGAVLLGVLITGLTIRGMPYYGQDVVRGAVLLVALLLTFTLPRRGTRARARGTTLPRSSGGVPAPEPASAATASQVRS